MASWTPISPWRLGACQTVAIGGSHAETGTAFNAQTRAVLIAATSDCHIVIGTSPVATSSGTLIRSAYPPLVFACGPTDKVSVIQDSAGGTLYVTELTH